MRRGAVAGVVALLLAGPAFADDAPPLGTAIETAAKANKPLVLEFYADWCGPCREFEKHVLPRPEVIEALEDVVFVRYDIDNSPGDEIATTLAIDGVPAFVVLDRSGKVIARQSGLAGANPHRRFVELLATAVHGVTMTARLEAAVRDAPNDIAARMRLGNTYKVLGRSVAALEQFQWVAEHAAHIPDVAAQAAALRDELTFSETRLATAVAMARTFVEAYPGSKLSSIRLAALAQSGRVPRDEIKLLAMAHLDAVTADTWPYAVRAALLADAIELAEASVADRIARQPSDPTVALVQAEVLLFTGKLADASRVVDRVCRDVGNELWCLALRQSIDLRQRTVPDIERLRDRAQDYLAALDKPSTDRIDHSIYALGEVDRAFGNTVANAFMVAHARCEHLAYRDTVAVVDIRVASVGRPGAVRVRSPRGGELDRCIASVLREMHFPRSVVAPQSLFGMLTFKAARGANRPERTAKVFGVMPLLAVRRGDIETYSFRGDMLAEVAGRRDQAWLVGGQAEFGGSDRGGPAYRARAFVGRSFSVLGPRIHGAVLVGAGVSDLATSSPLAFELPLEIRYRIDLGRLRVHLTGEVTPRFPGGMDTLFFVDTTVGAGATVPIGSRRFYLGAQHEAREGVGRNALVMFGTAIGDLY